MTISILLIMKIKRFKTVKRKIKNNIIFLILSIILCTTIIINYIGNKLTPVVEKIIEINVDKTIHNYLYNMFSVDVLSNENMMDLVNINFNNEGEVVAVDYRFDLVYKYLSSEMTNVFNGIRNMNIKMEYYDYENDLFFVPLGIINKGNILITDFGFKLPCKVVFFSDLRMYFTTKVSSYGINNLLVELYLNANVKNTILGPSTFNEFGNNYEIIVASKVIVGSIPMYYGEGITKSSAIVSS